MKLSDPKKKYNQPNDLILPVRFKDIDGKIKIYPLRKDIAIRLGIIKQTNGVTGY